MIAILILSGLLLAVFLFGVLVGRDEGRFERDAQDVEDRLDRIDFETERRYKL